MTHEKKKENKYKQNEFLDWTQNIQCFQRKLEFKDLLNGFNEACEKDQLFLKR